MTLKEQITKTIDTLGESELHQVAEYLSFLRFRSRQRHAKVDEKELANLYKEFAEEDRQLAEEGIEDYKRELLAEDSD